MQKQHEGVGGWDGGVSYKHVHAPFISYVAFALSVIDAGIAETGSSSALGGAEG